MPKRRKRIMVIVAFILILISIGVVLLFLKINPLLTSIINKQLSAIIRHDPHRIYDFTYDSLQIDIYDGDVIITNLRMIPRRNIIDSLQKSGLVNRNVVEADLGKFEMLNFDWVKFLRNGAIEVDLIRLAEVNIDYYLNKNAVVGNKESLGNDILDQNFISANAELAELMNANFRLFTIREDTSLSLAFDSLQLRISRIYSDSSLIKQPVGLELDEIDLDINDIENNMVDNYKVTSNKISFNSRDNHFNLNQIKMIPTQQKVDSKNWLELSVSSFQAIGLNYDSLLKNGQIIFNKILLEDPHFTYVRPVERLQKDTLRILPASTFKSIPVPMAIDTIQLLLGRFDYLKHGHNEPTISLNATHINVQGLFFSNDPVLMHENKTFYVSGSANFLDEANLNLNFTFPLMDPVNTFNIQGKMDTLDARSLNPIIKNSKQIAIEDGIINNLQFDITGNDTLATGALSIDYTNLKLVALKVNERDFSDTRQQGFLTGILNLVTKSNNDPEKSSFTEGLIYLERDPYYTFLDYSLESLMTGILTSMVPESKMFIKPKNSKNNSEQ